MLEIFLKKSFFFTLRHLIFGAGDGALMGIDVSGKNPPVKENIIEVTEIYDLVAYVMVMYRHTQPQN